MRFNLATELFTPDVLQMISIADKDKEAPKSFPASKALIQLLVSGGEKTAQDKARNFELLQRVYTYRDSVIDLKLDDLSVLKALADAQAPVLLYGLICEFLNNPLPEGS